MIELSRGDIVKAKAEALVNTVNCVGVMGRGIALQFKKAFPGNFKAYKAACDRNELRPGKVLVHDLNRLQNPRFIINVPTKRHWRGKSRLADIDLGLKALVEEVRRLGVGSIAVPPLGCGLGGLDWSVVRPRVEKAFEGVAGLKVLLFEPAGAPAARAMAKREHKPRMTIGRASLLGLMTRYLAAVMDPDVSLLEVHKLMYFMQEAGERLRLRFSKGQYGPYATNLRHVLNELEGHYISGFGDAADVPTRSLSLLGAASESEAFLKRHPRTQERFLRVAKLIEGFESPYGMELLATVHWATTREGLATPADVVREVYAWHRRKRMFSENHIGIALTVLEQHGWFEQEATG